MKARVIVRAKECPHRGALDFGGQEEKRDQIRHQYRSRGMSAWKRVAIGPDFLARESVFQEIRSIAFENELHEPDYGNVDEQTFANESLNTGRFEKVR